jgi:hypothetical protein
MISLKALQGKGVLIQNRKSKIENWYNTQIRVQRFRPVPDKPQSGWPKVNYLVKPCSSA